MPIIIEEPPNAIKAIKAIKPTITKIVAKFQLTIPPELRDLYGLRVGDLIEWNFDPTNAQIVLRPKRAQLLTPQVDADIAAIKAKRREGKLSARTAK
jgi:bifunctional DNA-binding transcriptional regulator/antitoxin component of YhaV-PrlF toxin-antitoxin module